MIIANNIGLSFGGRKLFDEVNIKFTPGNCYGLIGANGAGKSTFLKIITGDVEPQTGSIDMTPGERLSVLKQDHFAYDDYTVMEAVLMGNERLYTIMKEKDALYAKEDFSDEDGIRASELEAEFAELNGWEAEAEAGVLLAGLGITTEYNDKYMRELNGSEKVKVLLAQALIGKPDNLLLDEPTNHLDIKAINWLENFLLDFPNTVIVVSHDRHFLNKVCTHIADIDFRKITVYAGNYNFWKESSELALRLRADQKRKAEDKAAELKAFIQRFSANASKSSQATSRQKMLDKLQIDDLPVSTRKYPYVHFEQKRDAGKDILRVDGISKTVDGEKLLDNVSFVINKGDKIALIGENDVAKTLLFDILMGRVEADSGTFTWGITINPSYFLNDSTEFFADGKYNLVDWLRQYSEEKDDSFIRGFLGKMLFSGEEALKKTNVLSGGERVRCMLSKTMLEKPNFIILDNPIAHLDLESITAVNEGVVRYKGTALFTSHDHEFLQTTATRIIHLENGKIVGDKETTYDEYLGLN